MIAELVPVAFSLPTVWLISLHCGRASARPPLWPIAGWLSAWLVRGARVPGLVVVDGVAFPPGWRVNATASAVLVASPGRAPARCPRSQVGHAAAAAWHSWARTDGDPLALPIPPGWRLEAGVGTVAAAIAGDEFVVRDTAYAAALPIAFRQAHFMRRWRLVTLLTSIAASLLVFVVAYLAAAGLGA